MRIHLKAWFILKMPWDFNCCIINGFYKFQNGKLYTLNIFTLIIMAWQNDSLSYFFATLNLIAKEWQRNNNFSNNALTTGLFSVKKLRSFRSESILFYLNIGVNKSFCLPYSRSKMKMWFTKYERIDQLLLINSCRHFAAYWKIQQ